MGLLIFVLNTLITIYSMPIGLLSIAYCGVTNLLVKPLRIDMLLLAGILVVGVLNFNWNNYLQQPKLLINYYTQYGFFPLMNYQLANFSSTFFSGELILILVIPLMIRIFNLLNTKSSILPESTAHEISKDELKEQTLLTDSSNRQSPIIINDNELNQHCLLVGTTGSGKTTTMLHFVESMARRNLPVIYLDGKGSFDLVDKLSAIAKQYNRVFKVFMLRPGVDIPELAGYNPFSSGTATEWKNRIMSLFTQAQSRGQEHFSLGEQNYINFVANIIYRFGKPVDLRVILALLEQPNKLLDLAQKVDPLIAMKLTQLQNGGIDTKVNDVVKLLELFIYSDYGYLLNTTEEHSIKNVIKIRESILNNEIVLFLFDASTYPEDTRKVAKMVISDINSSFSEFSKFTKGLCIFDEFASYASENLAETISLQRSKGMHAIVGTQSIATVKLKSSDTRRIAEELIACCNTFIVQRINHVDDAELLARVIGTQKTYEVVYQTSPLQDNEINSKTFKPVEQLKISPQVLKDLQTGEAVIYRKAVTSATNGSWVSNSQPIKVKIRPLSNLYIKSGG